MSFLHSRLWKQNGGQCDWAYGEVTELSISIMTSIAPVSRHNIETNWRCGLKSVFSGEVHSRKRNSSYDGRSVIPGRAYPEV